MRNNTTKKTLILSLIIGLVLTGMMITGSFPRALADEVPVDVPTETPVAIQTPAPVVGDAVSNISIISSPQTIVCGETPTPDQYSITIYYMNGVVETG